MQSKEKLQREEKGRGFGLLMPPRYCSSGWLPASLTTQKERETIKLQLPSWRAKHKAGSTNPIWFYQHRMFGDIMSSRFKG